VSEVEPAALAGAARCKKAPMAGEQLSHASVGGKQRFVAKTA